MGESIKVKIKDLSFLLPLLPVLCVVFSEYQDTACVSNVLKDVGTALAIVSSLFSFTLSWLTDSKGYLSKIYEIKEAQDLYDKLNEKSQKLFSMWKIAFFTALALFAFAYYLGSFTVAQINTENLSYFVVFFITISLACIAYYYVFEFFSTASEILKFKNDLEKLICREEAKKRMRV